MSEHSMSVPTYLRFLRPCSHLPFSASTRKSHSQFYVAARNLNSCSKALSATPRSSARRLSTTTETTVQKLFGDSIAQRTAELSEANAYKHPRIKYDPCATTCSVFTDKYSFLKNGESQDAELVTLRGRVKSSRIASSKLVFVDIVQDSCRVQTLCNFGKVGVNDEQFRDFYHLVRRGDVISITGIPYRTKRGELSLNATTLPTILSPSLASHPTTLDDIDSRIKNRHADLLVNQSAMDTLKLRSHIVRFLRDFLLKDDFLEVQTPILAAIAGGAVARPFTTSTDELPGKTLSLRIAPEIWLKRLILGGMDRVFEIGSAFRNEGLDATHNPEFTTCEFYKSFAELEELMTMTESMINGLALHVNGLISTKLSSLPPFDSTSFTTPFNRIEFIPALESILGKPLPDLTSPTATADLISIFTSLSLPLPSAPTIPRLLDKLCSYYLEARCTAPTFITHHPACLAPLSKSFLDPNTNQLVSARAELFIGQREIANMYEEENSPNEQREKFEQQLKWRDDENTATVDESYVEALKWGLPPTGGWGCGVDRLAMLFSGARRISDVLAFGNLRHVVGLGAKDKGPA